MANPSEEKMINHLVERYRNKKEKYDSIAKKSYSKKNVDKDETINVSGYYEQWIDEESIDSADTVTDMFGWKWSIADAISNGLIKPVEKSKIHIQKVKHMNKFRDQLQIDKSNGSRLASQLLDDITEYRCDECGIIIDYNCAFTYCRNCA